MQDVQCGHINGACEDLEFPHLCLAVMLEATPGMDASPLGLRGQLGLHGPFHLWHL